MTRESAGLWILHFTVVLLLLFAASGPVIAQQADPVTTLTPAILPPMPVFFETPTDVYITKKSVDIRCGASPADNVYFVCNEEKMDETATHNLATFEEFAQNIRHIQLSITKDDVETYFGEEDFWCICEAGASPQPVRTEKAYIKIAYLKKQFIQVPLDRRFPLGSPIQLLCKPPEGIPEPEVHWEKDGVAIDHGSDARYLVTYAGSLIIHQATFPDTGNYTCVASNAATNRKSDPPALVTVYEDGDWSSWTEWGPCRGQCGSAVRKKTRTCSNPAPFNGRDCEGLSLETEPCVKACPGYGEWSPWSDCNQDCVRERHRECIITGCEGETMQTNCSGGLCGVLDDLGIKTQSTGEVTYNMPAVVEDLGIYSPKADDHTSENPTAKKPGLSQDLFIYIGIAIFIIFVLLIIVIVYLRSRRKQSNAPSFTTTITDDVNLAMLSAQPPDITTQTMHSSLRCNQVALPPHDEKIPISSTPTHSHHPDLTNGKVPHQLTVQFSPKKGGTITQLGCLGSSDISQYSLANGSLHSHPHNTHNTLSPTKSHTYVPLVGPGQDKHIYATLNPPEPPQVQVQVQDPRYCQTRYHGDLEDNNGYIMEEADESYMLQAHSSEESIEPQSMYDSDPGRASMASVGGLPVQSDYIIASGHVGYRGGRLVLPESGVSLMIPEGAIARGQTEEVYLAVSHELIDRPHTEHNQTLLSPVVLCGPPTVLLAKSVVLVLPHCAQMSKNDWRFSVIGSSTHPTDDKCWERQTTVGEETLNSPVFCQVDSHRCCVVTDQLGWYTFCGESLPERQSAKRLKLLAFGPALRSTLDYHIKVYISEDTPDALEHIQGVERRLGGQPLQGSCQFDYHDNGNNLRLEIQDIVPGWQCKLAKNCQEIPFYHVWSGTSNTLHCSFALAKTEPGIGPIGCRLEVTQGTYTTSMQVMERSIDGVCAEQELRLNGYSNCQLEPPHKAFHLSKPVRAALCQCLDTPKAKGNDWRLLAMKLGVDGYINFFAIRSSPTDQILDLWEARDSEEGALMRLAGALQEMGRPDAVAIVQKQMAAWMSQ